MRQKFSVCSTARPGATQFWRSLHRLLAALIFLTMGTSFPAQATTASLPTVSISYPPDGATVSGQTYVTISTGFNLPLTGRETQQVYLDGNLLWTNSGIINLVQPLLWDTGTLTSGAHTLVATAKDALGNTATSSPLSVTVSNGSGPDTTAPSSPANLTTTTVTCDKVSLSWAISTDVNGSGVEAYTLYRNEYPFGSISIAADRTSFADTDDVKSGTTYTYYLTAQDFAGNTSAASNAITVTTPTCSLASGEEVFDNADMQTSGRTIANFGSREAFVYQKLNRLTGRYDSYLQLKDEDTGAASHFLLHSNEYETDYILTNSTTLWTLVETSGSGLSVNQYQLNGSPIPTSATLVSTQPFGDADSCAKSLFKLESGALMAVWTTACADYGSSTAMELNVAYRNPSGIWATPIVVSLSPDNWKERITIAQHPADGSIWVFNKQDTGQSIRASHLTETSSGLTLDWSNPLYIATRNYSGLIQDGSNGPGDEYPFLIAAPDPARNTIDLAYQGNSNVYVHVDPLFQAGNGIFLKQDPIVVAQISADGTREFNVSPAYTERVAYFGLSVLGDGTLWLAYFPIDRDSLTWNRVYDVQYTNGAWSVPSVVGSDLNRIYNWSNSGPQWNPGFLISRIDRPQVAFRAPDGRVHSYHLDGTATVQDSVPPSTPTNLAASNITDSSVDLSWAASTDNVGIAGYDIFRCQGTGCTPVKIGTTTSSFYQDTGLTSATTYTFSVAAYDASNNVSSQSAPLTVNTVLSAPTVTITNPSNGAKLMNGSVSITASASDSLGIARMELYIDGIYKTQTAASSLSYKWSTRKLSLGGHTITSKAYDMGGNVGESSITVYK